MPERSCLICRGKSDKDLLMRFVWDSGRLCWDRNAVMEGRGVYLGRDCLGKALPSEKVWQRALRQEVSSAALKQIKDLLKEVLKEIKNEQNQNL